MNAERGIFRAATLLSRVRSPCVSWPLPRTQTQDSPNLPGRESFDVKMQ
jgi:hypothetical protein